MIRKQRRLLTRSNAKFLKQADRFAVAGLTLAPASSSGFNVCHYASDACIDACVMTTAGRTRMDTVRQAGIDRTRDLFDDRAAFVADLDADVRAFGRHAARRGVPAFVRLNAASDIDWRGVAPKVFRSFKYSSIRPFDYTKDIRRWLRQVDRDPDYHLTYSWSELSQAGLNVAVVFDTPYRPGARVQVRLPRWWTITAWRPTRPGRERHDALTVRVVDGDRHDVRRRTHDGAGVIVGLRGKGGAAVVRAAVASGFVQEACPTHETVRLY
jgi:hypothetical protein